MRNQTKNPSEVSHRKSKRNRRKAKGFMTLEATLVIPLFLFAVLNLYAAINYIGLHVRMTCAMEETGLQLAKEAYAYQKIAQGEEALTGEVADTILSVTYVKELTLSEAGRTFIDRVGIEGESSGVSFAQSDVTNGMYIDLHAIYKTRALFVPGFSGFQMANRAYLKAWTGYDIPENSEETSQDETLVYITETGTVYHLTRECTYLKLSIRQIVETELVTRRNQSGEKYTACELCGGGSGLIYVTEEGNRYHKDVTCSGLKRTVKAIPLSEVGDRPPCSRCGHG